MKYVEINGQTDIKLFKNFYDNILSKGFDINELETFDQLLDTLNKKKKGFFKNNSYHILVFLDKDILGGIIYDYFYEENCGLIEYIVTNPKEKRGGIASYMFNKTCELLNKEAQSKKNKKLDFVCCEVEKEINGKKANHYFWNKFGFTPLDFDYIQPPLEEGKEMVRFMNFGIIKNCLIQYDKDYLESDTLKKILYDYAYYTMRIENPSNEEYFKEMIKSINKDKVYFKKS